MKKNLKSILQLFIIASSTASFGAKIDLSSFKPLPQVEVPTTGTENHLWKLGRDLYMEKKLSKDNDISCNSCHMIDNYGVDNQPTSPGHKGQLGGRNSPTSFNAFLHVAQFWDGRAKDVEEQALGPITNPVEMALQDIETAVSILKADPSYQKKFSMAFPQEKQPVSKDNIAKAIGFFERTLVTPSRFDKFLNGDEKALSETEQRGLKTFVDVGCNSCHNGITVGGSAYFKMGLVKPYETKDEGRFAVTKIESDKSVFKVPSLRNIEKTYPYFHNGQVKSLESAVKLMGEHQLGKTLSNQEVNDIIAFLKSMTGELPKDVVMSIKQK